MKGKILLICLLALAIALSGCIEEPIACTEEARLCPNGTSVARNPALNCEFNPCPGTSPGTFKVKFEKDSVFKGEPISFSLKNNLADSVFLPECNEFLIQTRSINEWETVLEKTCVWEGNALEIKPGEAKEYSINTNNMPHGDYAINVSGKLDCSPELPLSEANCGTGIASVFAPFTIKSREPITNEKMKKCSVDEDCILINTDCCGCNSGGKNTAINKAFQQDWRNYLSCETKSVVCPAVMSNDPSCSENATAACIQEKCSVEIPPTEIL